MQRAIAAVEPQQRWENGIALRSDARVDEIQQRLDGQDAVAADEAIDLRPKRQEGDQKNDAQQAEENEA
jgi:hypothetical protein